MKNKLTIIFLILITYCNIYLHSEHKDLGEYNWIKDYMVLDASDDLYYGTIIKGFEPNEDYIKTLKYNRDIKFYIDEYDKFNLNQNTNMRFWLPFAPILFGGFNLSKGFNIGFLFKMDNLFNNRVNFYASQIYSQYGNFSTLLGFEVPYLLPDNRLKAFAHASVFTNITQYETAYNLYNPYDESDGIVEKLGNKIKEMPNKFWTKLEFDAFPLYKKSGLDFIAGANYRIPEVEVNFISAVKINYNYIEQAITNEGYYNQRDEDGNMTGPYPPDTESVNEHSLSLDLVEELRWDRQKATATIPVGNKLSGIFHFILPTTQGERSETFRFKSKIENVFNYSVWRETFFLKSRLVLIGNYNISEDFSGESYVRSVNQQDFTGFAGGIGNLEFYIPMIDVNLNKAAAMEVSRATNFIVFLSIFTDFGIMIENDNLFMDSHYFRDEKKYIDTAKNFSRSDFTIADSDYYMVPAFSVGAGLRVYPFFLDFILRLDISVNIMKSILKEESPDIELTISFNDLF